MKNKMKKCRHFGDDAMKYLPDNFDPDAELESARKEKYGNTDQSC